MGQRRDRLLFGFAEHTMTSTFLGTSTGLRRRFDQPDGRLELNGKSADYRRSAWIGEHTRDFADVDIGALTDGLNTGWTGPPHRIDLPAGRYETILPPHRCRRPDALRVLDGVGPRRRGGPQRVSRGNGGQTRIGERLSPLPLTLRSDPAEPGSAVRAVRDRHRVGGRPAVGVRQRRTRATPLDWITDGELTELIRTRAWAARTGARTAPARRQPDPGRQTARRALDDMIASTERGLLLTSLWYIREVDPQTLLLTGLTRDGVYLVENGAVRGAVNNFRFNESPVDLLGRITEVGRTMPTLPREWATTSPGRDARPCGFPTSTCRR